MKVFYDVREVPGLKKKPSTSELLDWLKLLLNEDIPPETLRESDRQARSRRCTARCSRTSRTCTCSNASPSSPSARARSSSRRAERTLETGGLSAA